MNFDNNHLTGITIQPATMKALVENKGAVIAPGGLIVMSAQAFDKLQGGVVNNAGLVEATGMAMKNGRIVLEASSSREQQRHHQCKRGRRRQSGGQCDHQCTDD